MCLKQVLQVGKLAKKGQRVGKTAWTSLAVELQWEPKEAQEIVGKWCISTEIDMVLLWLFKRLQMMPKRDYRRFINTITDVILFMNVLWWFSQKSINCIDFPIK